MGRPVRDLTGMIFGRLTVIARDGSNKEGNAMWICECECGNKTRVASGNLLSGNIKSCGCGRREFLHNNHPIKHNASRSRLYTIWIEMKSRCNNPNYTHYQQYGGRGIRVCDEWNGSFISFRDWALSNGYSDTLTIDRIDVNGNYEPSNCRWSTRKEQANNKRTCRYISFAGKTLTEKEWADALGINYNTLRKRLKKWTVERALTEKTNEKFRTTEKKGD